MLRERSFSPLLLKESDDTLVTHLQGKISEKVFLISTHLCSLVFGIHISVYSSTLL